MRHFLTCQVDFGRRFSEESKRLSEVAVRGPEAGFGALRVLISVIGWHLAVSRWCAAKVTTDTTACVVDYLTECRQCRCQTFRRSASRRPNLPGSGAGVPIDEQR